MKKFNFRFQKMLEYKESIEEKNRGIFNQELTAYNAEQSILKSLVDKIDNLNNQRNTSLKSTTINNLKQFNQYSVDICEKIGYQKDKVMQKEKDVQKAKKKLIESAKDKKTLEKLKEKHYDQYLFELKKDEEKIIDQLVSFKNGIR